MSSQMLLSELIATWDLFHITPEGFWDLQNALEASGVEIVNDINPCQPYERSIEVEDEGRFSDLSTIRKIAICSFSIIVAFGLYWILDSFSMIWR